MTKEFILGICGRVLGMHASQAKGLILSSGLIYRLVSVDGLYYGGDTFNIPNRINLELIDDKVTSARPG